MKILLTFLCSILCVNALAANTDERPNIIFLLADDFRWDSFGYMNKFGLTTPNLDRLAKQSVNFSKSYNTTAICQGSRANYVSGLYEFSTGTNFAHGGMDYSTWKNSYPAQLKANGYYTGFIGKFGFHVSSPDGKKGSADTVRPDFDYWAAWMGQGKYEITANPEASAWFERFAGKKEHTTHALGLMGADFIKQGVKSKKPFNLSVSFKAPHGPYTVDPRYQKIYAGKTFPKPENYGVDKNAPKQALSGRPASKGQKWMKNHDKAMANYHGLVYGLDQAVGRIIDTLEEQGVADNTVIIFAADNGFFNGSKGLSGKLYAYEEGTRSPTMIYHPKRYKSQFETSRVLSGNIDIAPTILDLANIKAPATMQGKSILPVLALKPEQQQLDMLHDSVLLMHVWGEKTAQSLAVVTPEHKYIHWFYGGLNGFERSEELFALTKDPYEQTNLAHSKEQQPTLLKMQQHYDNYLQMWQQQGVKDRGYPKYVRLADRNIPFEQNSTSDITSMSAGSNSKGGAVKKDKKNKKIKNSKKAKTE
ncbi:sulfatase-like hydrolase/transferase [Thalassotalea fonticola]|uniref:Sulfatase-like hydrolase/transferase n=1 Tax=Thalassotalea fonticola TaxID=3065649 RepID=A0ABZ0GW76_9GAMM|nr:sulfatase-like hydrolase/transferase [Colwelliaceae bacterium S1-1]